MRRICLLLFSMPLSLISFANNPIQSGTEFTINWITIWLCFFFGLLFTKAFGYLNRHSKQIDQRSDAALPLSGWVMFLGINLIARLGIQGYLFWKANYFVKSTWIHLESEGGASFHLFFIFQMFLSLFALTGTGALIYWFYGRRDIFPVMFVYYACFFLIANMILMLFNHSISFPSDMMILRQVPYLQVFRIVYAAVWVVFVLKSQNVRQTFVYPFR